MPVRARALQVLFRGLPRGKKWVNSHFAMELLANILLALIITVAILLVLVVLMQRPKSEGLGAAFGGGVTDNIFGAHTSSVLVKVTTYLAVIFFAAAVGYAALMRQIHSPLSETQEELLAAPIPETESVDGASANPSTDETSAAAPTAPSGEDRPTVAPGVLVPESAPADAGVNPPAATPVPEAN